MTKFICLHCSAETSLDLELFSSMRLRICPHLIISKSRNALLIGSSSSETPGKPSTPSGELTQQAWIDLRDSAKSGPNAPSPPPSASLRQSLLDSLAMPLDSTPSKRSQEKSSTGQQASGP